MKKKRSFLFFCASQGGRKMRPAFKGLVLLLMALGLQFSALAATDGDVNELVNTVSLQQDGKTITGKVVDTAGEPIPGATVVVKGTTTGTITDMDGNFTLSGVPENATLALLLEIKKVIIW